MTLSNTTLTDFLKRLNQSPDTVAFTDTIKLIDEHYHYTPAAFKNGDVFNGAGTNEGSCKIFAFAKLNGLSKPATLALFGKYYREDVLRHPAGRDHGNIRNFISLGWDGIEFDGPALAVK